MKSFALLFILLTTYAFGHPYQIIIFRHAEKEEGAKDFIDEMNALLTSQGQQRAAYLVHFLLQENIVNQTKYPISAIYVPKSSVFSSEGSYNYVRCTQTVLPLFHETNAYLKETHNKTLYINNEFLYSQAKDVLGHIMQQHFDGETVVICWEHHEIPNLFSGQFENIKNSLSHLGENRYDMIWVIRFNNEEVSELIFTQLPDNLFNYPSLTISEKKDVEE